MKVLLVVASKHGATQEIGERIERTLEASGLTVHVKLPETVTSLDGYDAVVCGSAVYVGHWMGPAKDFVARHRAALRERPVWLFSSGPIGDPPLPAGEPADAAALLESVGARGHQLFPGRLARRGLSLGEKVVVAGVRAPEGDYRPWDEVEAWAATIASALLAVAAQPVAS